MMKSSTKSILPQEGTRSSGEPLPGTSSSAEVEEPVSGCPTVSGGGKVLRTRNVRLADDVVDLAVGSDSLGESAALQKERDCRKRPVTVTECDPDEDHEAPRNELNWHNVQAYERELEEEKRTSPVGQALRARNLRIREMEMAGEDPMDLPDNPPPKRRSKKAPEYRGPTDEEFERATRVVIPWESSYGGPSAEEIHSIGNLCAEAIRGIVRKSGNLKGTCQRTLNNASITLQRALSNLTSRTTTSETKKLEDDNARLQREVDALKAEVAALRNDVRGRIPHSEAQPTTVQDPPVLGAMDEMKRFLSASINASIGAINNRLDRIERTGPDRARLPSGTTRGRRVEFPPLPPNSAVSTPFGRTRESVWASPLPDLTNAAPCAGTPLPSTALDPPAPPSLTFTDVPSKGRRRRMAKARRRRLPPVVVPTRPQAKTKQAPPARPAPTQNKERVRVRVPRSSAIVMQLLPEALEKGLTYTQVLKRAQDGVGPLEDIGIMSGVRCRTGATGARVIEVSGTQNNEKADRLAGLMQEALLDVAKIWRPVKSADVRITGLIESARPADVAEAVTRLTGCSNERLKVGNIRIGPNSSGSTIVSCPAAAARKLVSAGKLPVRWSVARVMAMESRPMRCFKCMGVGHTKPKCPVDADRTGICFRCGKLGHKAETCSKEPHCVVCAEAQRPAGHVMGGWACSPPPTKGKALGSETAQKEPEQGPTRVTEAEMTEVVEPSARSSGQPLSPIALPFARPKTPSVAHPENSPTRNAGPANNEGVEDPPLEERALTPSWSRPRQKDGRFAPKPRK